MSYPYEFLDPPPPAAVPGPAAASSEHRLATHDGYLWPTARPDMVLARAIRARMAEDAAELIRASGEDAVITAEDLCRLGWTTRQVKDHGTAAIAIAATDEREAA